MARRAGRQATIPLDSRATILYYMSICVTLLKEPMTLPAFPQLPPDLQARLAAAGVSDAATLAAALAADPALRRAYAAFLADNHDAIAAANRAILLDALPRIPDEQQLRALWQMVPSDDEDAFLAEAEDRAAAAEAAGDMGLATALRERINALHALQQEIAQDGELLRQALERLEAASSSDDAWQVWLDLPGDLEEWFLRAITERIAAVERDDTDLAERLRAAHTRMQSERNRRQEQANRPVVQALRAFLQAATDADATRVFNEYKALLQPFEAQRELDDLAQQAPDALRAAIAARAALLRTLRGVMPEPRPAPVEPPPRRAESTGDRIYVNSSHAEGGGSAIVVNNIVIERRWNRPRPERLPGDAIERTRDLERAAGIIAERGQLAITGGTRTATTAIQGMPGIGKTTLARQLALALDERYPGGVIWEEIGPEIRAPDDAQPI